MVLYRTKQSNVKDADGESQDTCACIYGDQRHRDFLPEDMDHSDRTYTEAKMALSIIAVFKIKAYIHKSETTPTQSV